VIILRCDGVLGITLETTSLNGLLSKRHPPVERLAAIFVHAALKRCYVAKCVVPDLRAQNFFNGMRNCLTSLAELSKIGDLARLNLAQRSI
jgi:hypothetical protein